jgi:hypothetical protein
MTVRLTGDCRTVRIEWRGKPSTPNNWVTIIQAGSSDDTQGSWHWALEPSGTSEWTYPFPPGNYEARFYLNNSYTVQERIGFRIP